MLFVTDKNYYTIGWGFSIYYCSVGVRGYVHNLSQLNSPVNRFPIRIWSPSTQRRYQRKFLRRSNSLWSNRPMKKKIPLPTPDKHTPDPSCGHHSWVRLVDVAVVVHFVRPFQWMAGKFKNSFNSIILSNACRCDTSVSVDLHSVNVVDLFSRKNARAECNAIRLFGWTCMKCQWILKLNHVWLSVCFNQIKTFHKVDQNDQHNFLD